MWVPAITQTVYLNFRLSLFAAFMRRAYHSPPPTRSTFWLLSSNLEMFVKFPVITDLKKKKTQPAWATEGVPGQARLHRGSKRKERKETKHLLESPRSRLSLVLCGKSQPAWPLQHQTCDIRCAWLGYLCRSQWTCRDVCGRHTLMDSWVSAHSFYQLISGSRSKGIIAIIPHYKHQTISFCWDSWDDVSCQRLFSSLHVCLRNGRRARFILSAFGSIESHETANKSFSEDLGGGSSSSLTLSFFFQELECVEKQQRKRGNRFCSRLVFCSYSETCREAWLQRLRMWVCFTNSGKGCMFKWVE